MRPIRAAQKPGLWRKLRDGWPWRRALRRADHAAIYLFMAGSYTPFALRDVPGGDGWLMEVLLATGGRPKTASFDLNGDGKFDGSDGVTLNGELVVVTGINPQVGVISGAPAVVVGAKAETKWVTGSAGGTPFSVSERIEARSSGRQSWIQLQ